MTEKDAVKCRPFAPDNWWYLPVSAELPDALGRRCCAPRARSPEGGRAPGALTGRHRIGTDGQRPDSGLALHIDMPGKIACGKSLKEFRCGTGY